MMGPLHGSFYGALLRAIRFLRHSLAYKSTGLIINLKLVKKYRVRCIRVSLTCASVSCTYRGTHYVNDMKVSISYVRYNLNHTVATQSNMAHAVASSMYRVQILTLRGRQEGWTYFLCSE